MKVVWKSVYHLKHLGDCTKITRLIDGEEVIYFVKGDACTCDGYKHRGRCKHLRMISNMFEGDYLGYAEFHALNTFLGEELSLPDLDPKPSDGYALARSIRFFNIKDLGSDTDMKIGEVLVGKKKFVVYIDKKGKV